VNPARSRHCHRGATLTSHGRKVGRRGEQRSESQDTRVVAFCNPGRSTPRELWRALMSRRSWVACTQAPPAATMAALADIGEINEYFALGTGPVSVGLLPVQQLYSDCELLEGIVERVSTRIGATERRVAVSTFFLGFAARLWSIGVGAVIGHRLLPDLGTPELSFVETGGHITLHVARPLAWQGDDLEPMLADLILDGHLTPLATALNRLGPISPKLLRGNAASALLGAANVFDRHRRAGSPDAARRLAERLCADQRLSGAIHFGAVGYRRASCCLYYRTRNSGLCGDCALTEIPVALGRKDAS
jgi:iron complex transport system ATP-binding protein